MPMTTCALFCAFVPVLLVCAQVALEAFYLMGIRQPAGVEVQLAGHCASVNPLHVVPWQNAVSGSGPRDVVGLSLSHA